MLPYSFRNGSLDPADAGLGMTANVCVLLAGMAFCGWLGLADFLGRLVAHPIGVENSGFINTLVGMGAEEIPLRLQQIGRQTCGTIAVEIGQGSAKGWHGHAVIDGG
jgi:hypothetical protein